jgi:hypothetical protein
MEETTVVVEKTPTSTTSTTTRAVRDDHRQLFGVISVLSVLMLGIVLLLTYLMFQENQRWQAVALQEKQSNSELQSLIDRINVDRNDLANKVAQLQNQFVDGEIDTDPCTRIGVSIGAASYSM